MATAWTPGCASSKPDRPHESRSYSRRAKSRSEASEAIRAPVEIAALEASAPYALLAFHPAFAMSDLRRTSRAAAEAAEAAAIEVGLTKVRIGNRHLLW